MTTPGQGHAERPGGPWPRDLRDVADRPTAATCVSGFVARGPRRSCLRPAVRLAPHCVALVLLIGPAVNCIPPDFTIESGANKPIRIDRTKLQVSPDGTQILASCPLTLDLDVTPGVENPDGDRVYSAWFVNGLSVDRAKTNGTDVFPFDACILGPRPSTGIYEVQTFVLDRLPQSLNSIEDTLTFVDPETSYDTVVWFVYVEDTTCCTAGDL